MNGVALSSIVNQNVNKLLVRAFSQIENDGEVHSPRGIETKEIRNAVLVLTDSTKGICTLEDRKTSYKLIIAEFLMYVCGWGDKQNHSLLLSAICPGISEFINPATGLFNGAYGARIKNRLFYVAQLLRQDPDSRQAVIPIYRAEDLERSVSEDPNLRMDIPCTCLLNFSIRNGKLECTDYMRSSDIYWGLPHDFGAFTLLQRFLAAWIGVDPGSFTLIANSLHYYDDIRGEKARSAYQPLNYLMTNDILPLNFEKYKGRCFVVSELEEILDSAWEYYSVIFNVEEEHLKSIQATIRATYDEKFEKKGEIFLNLWKGITGRLIKKNKDKFNKDFDDILETSSLKTSS